MHSYGRQIYTTKNGDITNIAHYWDFGFQENTDVNFQIKAGDELHTHCVFDTKQSGGTVDFGTASSDEMCQNFLMYYPRVPRFQLCGWFKYDIGIPITGAICGGTDNSGDNSDFISDVIDACLENLNSPQCLFHLGTQDTDGKSFLPETLSERTCANSSDGPKSSNIPLIAGASAAAAVILISLATLYIRMKRRTGQGQRDVAIKL
mmetsp:Transcript_19276/g.23464  ORF Transcript_19276/g.23464 Transcript_19276/m.23464 type:complete len:206 (-) Transcript_19276:153-770(-)